MYIETNFNDVDTVGHTVPDEIALEVIKHKVSRMTVDDLSRGGVNIRLRDIFMMEYHAARRQFNNECNFDDYFIAFHQKKMRTSSSNDDGGNNVAG